MEKIIEIRNKNNQYKIYLSNKQKLYCQKNTKEKLNKEDKKIINRALNYLLIKTKTSQFISKEEYNKIPYNLYIDTKNNLYYSNSLDINIIKYINKTYNNMPTNLYKKENDEENEEDKSYITIIEKGLSEIIIPVTTSILIISIILTSIANKNNREIEINSSYQQSPYEIEEIIDNSEEFELYEIEEPKQKTSYTFDDIKDALDQNPNVDQEFKDYFYKLNFIFIEDAKYIQVDEQFLDKAKTLKVVYDPQRNDTIKGKYNFKDNIITYYNSNQITDLSAGTIYHEIGHFIQTMVNYNYCIELSNEIWTRETLERMVQKELLPQNAFLRESSFNDYVYGNGYDESLNIYYYLMELMDKDSIMKYQYHPATYTIISALLGNDKYDESKRKTVTTLLRKINSLKKDENNNKNTRTEILSLLDELYKANKGYSLSDSINTLAFRTSREIFDEKLIKMFTNKEEPEENALIIKQKPKTYFSDTREKQMIVKPLVNYVVQDQYIVNITAKIEEQYLKTKDNQKIKTY